jgi:hypothetical protein
LVDRSRKAKAVICGASALVASALVLSGCSSPIADMPSLETPTAADTPARPREAGAYLPVNDLPPDRDAATISPDERAKIEKELTAARDRQASASASKDAGNKDAGK